mmetsp:Transcript_829/g.2517  ORF Transcript_829/g.2517 Transcript_829/m.2517 type:complete len:298 (-) Transcript_829:34-927(-)
MHVPASASQWPSASGIRVSFACQARQLPRATTHAASSEHGVFASAEARERAPRMDFASRKVRESDGIDSPSCAGCQSHGKRFASTNASRRGNNERAVASRTHMGNDCARLVRRAGVVSGMATSATRSAKDGRNASGCVGGTANGVGSSAPAAARALACFACRATASDTLACADSISACVNRSTVMGGRCSLPWHSSRNAERMKPRPRMPRQVAVSHSSARAGNMEQHGARDSDDRARQRAASAPCSCSSSATMVPLSFDGEPLSLTTTTAGRSFVDSREGLGAASSFRSSLPTLTCV